ncbi:hypothetical protein TRAPUB_3060 [Trametes pubescens]|uniref:Uncharacterized protein n=1 Tax=Trametes pubescens TaxID=154538 RepID=A0A1M2VEV1_TRAPU|nr:hypothetical protein TRAPUB_3060 [Trametes pubescens]
MANAHLQVETAALSEEHAGPINFITTNPKLPRYAEWKIFVNIVMKELPIMNAYENGWPIAYIVRGHRHLKKKGCAAGLLNWEAKAPLGFSSKRRATLDVSEHPDLRRAAASAVGRPASASAAAKGPPPVVSSRRPAHSPDAGRPRDCTRSARPYDRPRDSTPCPRGSQFLQSVYIRPRPGASSSSTRTGTSSSTAGPSSSASDTGTHDDLEPVREFLRALQPEQSGLLPVLVAKGVRTGADLDGLACMPRERRKRLFVLWLLEEAITQLQFDALDAGFEAMVS